MDNGKTDPATTEYRKNWDRIFGTKLKRAPKPAACPRAIIVENSIRCLQCGDVITSKHRHDFVTCSCGRSSVDGGSDYLRRVGDSWEELSTSEPWREPQAGDILNLLIPIHTAARVKYAAGDALVLIEPSTTDFNGRTRAGCWKLVCKHFPEGKIWSDIEAMIRGRVVELVRP